MLLEKGSNESHQPVYRLCFYMLHCRIGEFITLQSVYNHRGLLVFENFISIKSVSVVYGRNIPFITSLDLKLELVSVRNIQQLYSETLLFMTHVKSLPKDISPSAASFLESFRFDPMVKALICYIIATCMLIERAFCHTCTSNFFVGCRIFGYCRQQARSAQPYSAV